MSEFVALLVVAVSILFLAIVVRSRIFFAPIATAYCVRALIALMHQYVYRLPQGRADAVRFERVAWDWAQQGGCGSFFEFFNPSNSYVYSAVISEFYACTARSPLGAQMINVFLGTIAVLLIAQITRRIWGEKAAIKAAWVAALFPALIIYSVVTLREMFILVPFLIGVLFAVRAVQRNSMVSFVLAGAGFITAAMFHGAMVIAVGALILAPVFAYWKQLLQLYKRGLLHRAVVLTIVLSATLVGYLTVSDGVRLSSIGRLDTISDESLADASGNRARGGAGYLVGLPTTGPLDVVWQTPIRMVYFLYAPFPWNISAPNHLLGLIDAAGYMVLSWLLWRNRDRWWHRTELRAIFIIFMVMVLVFAWGTSNFGTGMRHRAKFFGILLVMAAPFIPKLRRISFRARAKPPVRT